MRWIQGMLILLGVCGVAMSSFAQDGGMKKIGDCTYEDLNKLVVAKWGGFWSQGKKHGYYRVLVFRLGWEHTHDQVQLEVIENDEKLKKTKVLYCIPVQSADENGPLVRDVAIEDFRVNLAKVTLSNYIRKIPGLYTRKVYLMKPSGKYKKIMETRVHMGALNDIYDRQGL